MKIISYITLAAITMSQCYGMSGAASWEQESMANGFSMIPNAHPGMSSTQQFGNMPLTQTMGRNASYVEASALSRQSGNTPVVSSWVNEQFATPGSAQIANRFSMIQDAHNEQRMQQIRQPMVLQTGQQMMQDMAPQADQQLLSQETSISEYSQQGSGDWLLNQSSDRVLEGRSRKSLRVSSSDSAGRKPPRSPLVEPQGQQPSTHAGYPKWMPQGEALTEAAEVILNVLTQIAHDNGKKASLCAISGTDQEILAAYVLTKKVDAQLTNSGITLPTWHRLAHYYAVKYDMVNETRGVRTRRITALDDATQEAIIDLFNRGARSLLEIAQEVFGVTTKEEYSDWHTKSSAVKRFVKKLELQGGRAQLIGKNQKPVKVYEVVGEQLRRVLQEQHEVTSAFTVRHKLVLDEGMWEIAK